MGFLPPKEQLELLKKGVVDLVSEEELLKKLEDSYQKNRPLRIKFGADPSRPDIHLGHTVVLNKLKQFQDLGHHILFLIGDFTAMIGDPTGKNETRPILTEQEVRTNADSYAEQVFKILCPENTEVVFNSHWLNQLKPDDFIRLTAQYTVARMLERDDFNKRYRSGVPISIHEFLYPLAQGYDSVALYADVELGGTDQRFNLLVGRDLQKSYGQAPQCVITMPILEGLDGVQKMSKSANNYIGVDEAPREMFGKTMRISDELMYRYYELLTDKTQVEIAQMRGTVTEGRANPRDFKIQLAKILVARFHSVSAAQNAEDEFHRVFVNKGLPDEIPEVSVEPQPDVWICHLLVRAQLAPSTSEARRLVQGGAVEVNQEKMANDQLRLDLRGGDAIMLKVGKKRFAKVLVK